MQQYVDSTITHERVTRAALEVLERMKTRLGSPHCWTSAALARDRFGEPVEAHSRAAVRWDVFGAMLAETHGIDDPDMKQAVKAAVRRWLLGDDMTIGMVNRKSKDDILMVVNDDLSFPEVHDWLRRAMEIGHLALSN